MVVVQDEDTGHGGARSRVADATRSPGPPTHASEVVVCTRSNDCHMERHAERDGHAENERVVDLNVALEYVALASRLFPYPSMQRDPYHNSPVHLHARLHLLL